MGIVPLSIYSAEGRLNILYTGLVHRRGGEGQSEGKKAWMGWDRGWVRDLGWGAGRMLLWQQTDWQKCKQSLLVQGEREK